MKKQLLALISLLVLMVHGQAQVNVTPASGGQVLCPAGGYILLGDIIIDEGFQGNFVFDSASTYVMRPPTNFQFDTLSGIITEYNSPKLVVDSFSITPDSIFFRMLNFRNPFCGGPACGPKGKIRLRNLKVKALIPAGPANIYRTGGSAIFFGDQPVDLRNHGTLATLSVNPAVITTQGGQSGGHTICNGSNDTLIVNTGSQSVASYVWSSGETTSQIYPSQAGSYIVTATYVSGGCPAVSAPFLLDTFSNLPPVILPSNTVVVCTASTAPVYVQNPNNYLNFLWTPSGVTNDTLSAPFPTQQQNYTVRTTNLNGCINFANVTVMAQDFTLPTINRFGPPIPCEGHDNQYQRGDSVFLYTFLATDTAARFLWSNGSTLDSIVVRDTTPGVDDWVYYSVIAEDHNECLHQSLVDSIHFQALPEAGYTVSNFCISDSIEFRNASDTIAGDPIVDWAWDFGDFLTPGTGSIASHLYHSGAGNYLVTLTVEAASGCEDTVRRLVYFAAPPVPNFSWNFVCDGDATEFQSLAVAALGDAIDSLRWDFGDGNFGTGNAPVHTYNAVGTYPIVLTVWTDKDCRVDTLMPITIYPLVSTPHYIADFENGKQGWEAEGNPSTWTWGHPNKSQIITAHSGTNAWVTNLTGQYGNDEDGAVYSPCFDVSSLRRPMVKIAYNLDVEPGVDGANLQYTTDNGLTWTALGAVGEGIYWYDDISVTAQPGDTNPGWATNTNGWHVARHTFEEGLGQGRIRFRIPFASDNLRVNDGMAFDDFELLDRSKLTLLEHFTCNVNPGDYWPNYVLRNFIDHNSRDLMPIYYHVYNGLVASNDDFYDDNIDASNTRHGDYGLEPSPWCALDGTAYRGRPTLSDGLTQARLDSMMLMEPLFAIDSITMSMGHSGTATVAVRYLAADTLTNAVRIRAAVVETFVNGSSPNGETYFPWVMRDVPVGTILQPPFVSAAQARQVDLNWTAASSANSANLGLVVFVQDEATKEVYQAAYLGPDRLVGNLEPQSTEATGIWLSCYPNPAAHSVTFLSEKPMQEIQILDAAGRLMCIAAATGYHHHMDLQGLAAGIYSARVVGKNATATLKLVVVN